MPFYHFSYYWQRGSVYWSTFSQSQDNCKISQKSQPLIEQYLQLIFSKMNFLSNLKKKSSSRSWSYLDKKYISHVTTRCTRRVEHLPDSSYSSFYRNSAAFGSIKLTLKNASGNVSHGHILAHNNDNRSNVTVMIASRSLLQIAILAPAVEFDTREIVLLLLW